MLSKNATRNESGDDFRCGSYDYGLRYLVAIYPAYIRFAQCIRRMKDSPKNKKLHHLANALKYSTSFVKVFFAAIYSKYKSTGKTQYISWTRLEMFFKQHWS